MQVLMIWNTLWVELWKVRPKTMDDKLSKCLDRCLLCLFLRDHTFGGLRWPSLLCGTRCPTGWGWTANPKAVMFWSQKVGGLCKNTLFLRWRRTPHNVKTLNSHEQIQPCPLGRHVFWLFTPGSPAWRIPPRKFHLGDFHTVRREQWNTIRQKLFLNNST